MEGIIIGEFSHWVIELDQLPYLYTSINEVREFLLNSRGRTVQILVFKDSAGIEHPQIERNHNIRPGDKAFKRGEGRWEIGVPPQATATVAGSHLGAD